MRVDNDRFCFFASSCHTYIFETDLDKLIKKMRKHIKYKNGIFSNGDFSYNVYYLPPIKETSYQINRDYADTNKWYVTNTKAIFLGEYKVKKKNEKECTENKEQEHICSYCGYTGKQFLKMIDLQCPQCLNVQRSGRRIKERIFVEGKGGE